MRFLRLGGSIALALVLSTQWFALSRITSQFYTPLAIQCFVGAMVLSLLVFIFERRLPLLSMKSLHASISLSTLLYLLSGILTLYCIRRLPYGMVGLTFSITPIWLFAYGLGSSPKKLIYLVTAILGLALVLVAMTPANTLVREMPWLVFSLLLLSSLLFGTALALTKKVFWIHSATELNFWALIFAGLMLGIFGLVHREWGPMATTAEWAPRQWQFVLYGGIVIGGVASFCYRFLAFMPDRLSMLLTTILVPVGALAINHQFPSDQMAYPFGLLGMIATGITIVSVVLASIGESPSVWMGHYINNSRRQGDRVACRLTGFAKGAKGGINKILVSDLSIGGLGFFSETQIPIGEEIVITLPLGQAWTQVALDCKVVHSERYEKGGELPWNGGLVFKNVKIQNLQILVEFLARIGTPSERDPAQAA